MICPLLNKAPNYVFVRSCFALYQTERFICTNIIGTIWIQSTICLTGAKLYQQTQKCLKICSSLLSEYIRINMVTIDLLVKGETFFIDSGLS